jgi:hypothetical protein
MAAELSLSTSAHPIDDLGTEGDNVKRGWHGGIATPDQSGETTVQGEASSDTPYTLTEHRLGPANSP